MSTQTLNTHREVLGQQALALLKNFTGDITSSEYRILARSLQTAGYWDDAESVWRAAVNQGAYEGMTQAIFSHRGFGTFLFEWSKVEPAREQYEQAKAVVLTSPDDDASVTLQAETLIFWAEHEAALANSGNTRAMELINEAAEVAGRVKWTNVRLQLESRIADNRSRISQIVDGMDCHGFNQSLGE